MKPIIFYFSITKLLYMNALLKQIITILLFSVILGIFRFYLIGDKNFTLFKKEKTLKKINFEEQLFIIPELMTEPHLASTSFVKYYYDKGIAIIIDSRDIEDYNNSHIEGSINIPYNYYDDFIVDEGDKILLTSTNRILPLEGLYIIYCNGGECDLSLDLAYVMFEEFNFENIFVYEDGLPEWEKANYPIAK